MCGINYLSCTYNLWYSGHLTLMFLGLADLCHYLGLITLMCTSFFGYFYFNLLTCTGLPIFRFLSLLTFISAGSSYSITNMDKPKK